MEEQRRTENCSSCLSLIETIRGRAVKLFAESPSRDLLSRALGRSLINASPGGGGGGRGVEKGGARAPHYERRLVE